MNLKPVLRADLDVEGSALCAQAMNDDSKSAADIVMTNAARRFVLPGVIRTNARGIPF